MEEEKVRSNVDPVVEVEESEPVEDNRFDKEIYSNVASNRYENLRTSYIENKAKKMRETRK